MLAACLAALALGLGSAWYVLDNGLAMTTGRIGPWSIWRSAGAPDADPYTRAHLSRSGRLPITSANAHYYFADRDDAGRPLRAGCEYAVEGPSLASSWWSLSLYDSAGGLIPNKAGRHAYNVRNIVRDNDGAYTVTLARNARPGNWLPTGERDTELVLVLRVYATRSYAGGLHRIAHSLPNIVAVDCP